MMFVFQHSVQAASFLSIITCCRYVGSWKAQPLGLDRVLRKPAAILSKLQGGLAPQEVQALLSHEGFNAPSLRHAHLSTSSSSTFAQWELNSKLLSSYSFDHIIPASRRGQDHPDNYFLMPLRVNGYFGNGWTAEKVAYIGAGAAMAAGRLRWHGLKLKPSLLSKLQVSDPTSVTSWAGILF